MSDAHSTPALTPAKPERPDGSPLFWHATGRWAKKIRGKLCYFGRGNHDEAIEAYNAVKDDLHAGRRPKDEEPEGLTVYQLCAKFLTAKKTQRDNGELSPRMFAEYGETCKRLTRVFGKARLVSDLSPDDFAKLRKKMAKTWGLVRLKAEIIRSRTPFLWAKEEGLTGEPVYGGAFKVPSAGSIRREKAQNGPKLFEADEIRRMLAAAGQPIRAMLLLGINGGLGNTDLATMPLKALDLDGGWLNYPRPKTGISRRIPLWPETVAAIREWLPARPEPTHEADAELVFITKYGNSWASQNERTITKEIRKLLDSLGINGSRNFYALRHTFQTIGDESGDFIAVRKIMGHAGAGDVADLYRERISDERLMKVTEHVRQWLTRDCKPGTLG
jgi:integrase